MEIDVTKWRNSLEKIQKCAGKSVDEEISKVLRLSKWDDKTVKKIFSILSERIVDKTWTDSIGREFKEILLIIVSESFREAPQASSTDYQSVHRAHCVALSKLIKYNKAILRFSFDFFTKNPSPFDEIQSNAPAKKKKKVTSVISSLEIVESCLRFLKADRTFFRNAWKWSKFLDNYLNRGCNLQQLICNEILGILVNMSRGQMDFLNKNIPQEVITVREMITEDIQDSTIIPEIDHSPEQKINWEISCENVIIIEGVSLAVFNVENRHFYEKELKNRDSLIMVDSTRSNIRNLCLGIGCGKAICLQGAVGSGKTTLVDELAKKTGHIAPNIPGVEAQNGFLRIQLGHQTDSKALLGQHRCTDIPGEFSWQPGILTQAVISGYWLLLEDLDLATSDVCTVLTNLLESNALSVPGFRENIRIAPGFQLFITLRSQKAGSGSNSLFSLLEKHLFTVNIISLSREELCLVVQSNFPKLTTIARKIVEVFLLFSSGDHTDELADDEENSRNKFGSTALNSGRQVSTRDLLKLCKRSHPNFNVTSTECAYLVFQNAVDLFCSHLPDGKEKTELIKRIGGKLGIIESRCQSLAEDYKPQVELGDSTLQVGRVEMSRWREQEANGKRKKDLQSGEVAKKRKTGQEDQVKSLHHILEKNIPTFSFTRLASCLLERISMAVVQNEPILLVGETGVGKTSAVQYLAHQTAHKLVVVNMNNQSDISDLLGGFKPVDLHYVVAPLFSDFQYLLRTTFDAGKNEKFLESMLETFANKHYKKLVKAMLQIVDHTLKSYERKTGASLQKKLNDNWLALKQKLQKLTEQMKNSNNMSFAFISGALVNCLKDGNWILLDEINLASTETLECLATILEPDGSVVLLEKGDYVPVQRHKNFRLFACMNPNTDIGKKDLPIGIRNRFTEFFVDELKNVSDLRCLVGDYLQSTGIQTSKVMEVVKLYRDLREKAKLELNDGLGNRPVYSLRTLCRALTICAKNLCGSVERNLYESFCMSFLTQLDSQSHKSVLQMIQKKLIGDAERLKAVLTYQIPKPPNKKCEFFEGYWIECGEKEAKEWDTYILTESVRQNLKDLARIVSLGKLPVLLQGPTSAGKTSLIEYVARRSGNHCLRINNHEHTDLQEYIGTYTADVTGRLVFQEGVLVQAMRQGYWIILDELNLASSDILEALNRVLDDNRELFIPETQTLIKAHPNFMLFATQNPPGIYGGRKTLSRAFKNRFIELHFGEIPREELAEILQKRCQIPKSLADKMVSTMSILHTNRRNVTKSNFTLRDLFRWGNRYTLADKKLLEDPKYDWNQHLVDEGYLVLSARVRNPSDLEAIQDSLFLKFRKHPSLDNLFNHHDNTSAVTKAVLDDLMQCEAAKKIHWSSDILRIYVQVAKALSFQEPVLLVGPTGCGKTTVCQIVAETLFKKLRILNCHMHTEAADFLGGLRPYRNQEQASGKKRQLFEWADGPLVQAMQEGSHFLADEISLADDSILERLNSILEPERTVLLAEKGGIDEGLLVSRANDDFIIQAHQDFKFLATMNPGGDFGKKELSPALRNRFTEIWCTTPTCPEHLQQIGILHLTGIDEAEALAKCIVDVLIFMKITVDRLTFSVRDIVSWAQYIRTNVENNPSQLSLPEILFYGLDTLFLDFLEMLPHRESEEIEAVRKKILQFLVAKLRELFHTDLKGMDLLKNQGDVVQRINNKFGIHPFYLAITDENHEDPADFSFSAPTTKRNLFQLLSGLSLNKAILLEGPPGVGKTSLVVNLAKATGHKIVRINLCEHTDLADLFGTDLPADDHSLDVLTDETKGDSLRGAFVWRDGPLLAALKAPNTWILLDELNLAPQSVLEGLNAILDHRGEVFIPELNKTFKLGHMTRIFASQNPLKQGGGRKGLPQSFLNRFTKVYLRKLRQEDLLHVIEAQYSEFFSRFKEIDLPKKMVLFSDILDKGTESLEFGLRGGPFEINLRDILRWCDFLTSEWSGFAQTTENHSDFILTIYEKMKLVYSERMRTESDKVFIRKAFSETFNCDAEDLEKISENVSFYWTEDHLYLNDLVISRADMTENVEKTPLILQSQLKMMKNTMECVKLSRPVLLCGPGDCGKTKCIDLVSSLLNQPTDVDTIDDSVTGSFQQVDLNRHLEEIARIVEVQIISTVKITLLNGEDIQQVLRVIDQWEDYNLLLKNLTGSSLKITINEEVKLFRDRLNQLLKTFNTLKSYQNSSQKSEIFDKIEKAILNLKKIADSSVSLNTGGHFEWVDSKFVKCMKAGRFICLEHVNMCSSAILDRLNSAFESNGSLLISEKGISADNCIEEVRKHEDFRAFLTLDPRNGEISRAMRNRCLEIFMERDSYTRDDLRHIIYDTGVHNLSTIDIMIRIHERLRKVSEFTLFGVKDLFKFALLVVENQSLSYVSKKIIKSCAVEVYVRSTNTDVLGFGLKFYRNRLEEEIEDEVKMTTLEDNKVGIENVVLRSDKLTTIARIKLQCELFLSVIKNSSSNMKILQQISTEFEMIHINNEDNFWKYLLFCFYTMSSLRDIEKRRLYVQGKIKDVPESSQKKIVKMNETIPMKIQEFLKEMSDFSINLPWNDRIFPRIRDYKNQKLNTEDQNRLILLTAWLIFVEDIEVRSSPKLSEIDAITYSKAVDSKDLVDSLNKDFLRHLYPFLKNLECAFEETVLKTMTVCREDYFENAILAILWRNRILSACQEKICINRRLNDVVMNRIILHINWLVKNLVPLLDGDETSFTRSLREITKCIQREMHPLNLMRKFFTKKITKFLPHYKWAQISLSHFLKMTSENMSINENLRNIPEADVIKRLKIATSEDYLNLQEEIAKIVEDVTKCDVEDEVAVNNISHLTERVQEMIDRDRDNKHFQTNTTEILPILEYFATKVISIEEQPNINKDFFLKVKPSSVEELQVIALTSDQRPCEDLQIEAANQRSREKLQKQIVMNLHNKKYPNDREDLLGRSGPLLTQSLMSVLLSPDGELKEAGLDILEAFKKNLKKMSQIIWSNMETMSRKQFDLKLNDFKSAREKGKLLLREIQYTRQQLSSPENADNNEDFFILVEFLERELEKAEGSCNEVNFSSSILFSLIGAIELNLLCYLPLLDPVEKHRLKRSYLDEDMSHLGDLISAHRSMGIMCKYSLLGDGFVQIFLQKLESLKMLQGKMNKKLALRPEECEFAELTHCIEHFIHSCCKPKELHKLIVGVREFHDESHEDEKKMVKIGSEFMKKLESWMKNSANFQYHILPKYSTHYRDFVEPMDYAVTLTKYGLTGLVDHLKMRCSLQEKLPKDITSNHLTMSLQSLITFPRVSMNENAEFFILKKIFKTLPNGEDFLVKLLKSNLVKTTNDILIRQHISKDATTNIDNIFKTFSKMWQIQEDEKRKKKIEEESLYVTKIKCQTEDEDEMIREEIDMNFPTSVAEDFGDLLQNDTLEKIHTKKVSSSQVCKETITSDDVKIIATSFLKLMNVSSHSECKLDYVDNFRVRVKIFVNLLKQFRMCLTANIDDASYLGISILTRISQNNYEISEHHEAAKDYNFYKDSNISEILPSLHLLNEIEERTKGELKQWPDHASLNDIITLIDRIRAFPVTSAIVRFSTGFQLLGKKIDEWNSVAHRNNNMLDLKIKLTEFIQRWTKLELHYWRHCLTHTWENVKNQGCKYWFFIFNLIHEYLETGKTTSIAEFEESAGKTIETLDVVKTLNQFMESSTYAEFSLRLDLLKAFEKYLGSIPIENERKNHLIAIIFNVHLYFSQFMSLVDDLIQLKRRPIEKELKDRVKIASYTPDLSYLSMKNNIKEMHKKVHKCLKQFEEIIKDKMTPIFVGEEAKTTTSIVESLEEIQDRYTINVNNFLVAEKLKERCPNSEKVFVVSRNLVKKTILYCQHPGNIYTLEQLVADQMETSEYLRKLEVDRSVERDKQKSQAKQILNQKRKSLADFFKTLNSLGLSYRAGLMEFSLNPEVVDLKIPSFNLDDARLRRKFNGNLLTFGENIDGKFAKCCYRFKRLITVLLCPSSELGLQNIERIKGFSVDLFLLMQNQRKLISSSVKNLHEIQKSIEDLVDLNSATGKTNQDVSLDFVSSEHQMKKIVDSSCKIRDVLEQFKLLLKTAPNDNDPQLMVLARPSFQMTQNSDGMKILLQIADTTIVSASRLINKADKKKSLKFYSSAFVQSCQNDLTEIMNKITEIKKYLQKEDITLILAKPLDDLLKVLQEIQGSNENDQVEVQTEDDFIKISDNIAFAVRIAMQKLFKKIVSSETATKESSTNEDKEDIDNPLLDNHLRQEICEKLITDMADLNLKSISSALSDAILVIRCNKIPTKTLKILISSMLEKIPLLQQFVLLAEFFLTQQVSVHRLSMKMLALMLSVFAELTSKGFCIPQDLMQDIEQEEKQKEEGGKKGEGFGLEDGSGENDVSDKIESEDQLEDAKKPGEDKSNDDKEKPDCKEEKGIEMSEDFDSHLQDVDDKDNEDDLSESEDDEDRDKQMGETDQGADKLDDQLWDDENKESEDEAEDDKDKDMNEDEGKGSNDTKETHDDLSAEKQNEGEHQQEDGLDAADQDAQQEKKQQQKDIDKMQEPEIDEDQVNPYHNDLEEPPEAEPMDLGDGANVDDDDGQDNQNNEENPFDIDTMKDQMVNDDEDQAPNEDAEKDEEKPDPHSSDSEDESSAIPEGKADTEDAPNPNEETEDEQKEDAKIPDQIEENDAEQEDGEERDQNVQRPENHESKDASSKEDNVQAMPDSENKGSADQVPIDDQKNDQVSNEDMADQETGEDKEGVGQAKNEESKSGHKGISEGAEMKNKDRESAAEKKEKRKQGNTNEDRTLGDSSQSKKQLKTIEKLKEHEKEDSDDGNGQEHEAEEYQHVKDAKKYDKTTLDNATEEQSKAIQHEDDNKKDENEEDHEDVDNQIQPDNSEDESSDVEMLDAEKVDGESTRASKKDEKKQQEKCEQVERGEIEGEDVPTMSAHRPDDTAAHYQMDIVQDATLPHEPDVRESLEMRKMFHKEVMAVKTVCPDQEDFERWQEVSMKMMQNARDLCEQLRLILEPTKCTRMKGDYRTGRRINMKKIIPYLASQFRKDKIWLRRTKPAQRDYKIIIAIDDSKSMHHNNSKELTLEAISLVSQALTLLESGKLSIVSFGERPQILLNHTEQFDGPKLVRCLNFDQNKTNIAELVNFVRVANQEDGASGSSNGIFENLLLILSDGRNIFNEGSQNGRLKVKDAVKLARLQRIFTVYIIIDNPENKHSIMDIPVVSFTADNKTIMKPYLDTFPFPYYVIVRDLNQLPMVLSDAMRQWFELVNSEA
ncbi:Midasin [Sergentomyia squamirostris]